MTKISRRDKSVSEISPIGLDRRENVSATCGNEFHASQAVFFPIPWKQETVSHPVMACRNGKPAHLLGPSVEAMS